MALISLTRPALKAAIGIGKRTLGHPRQSGARWGAAARPGSVRFRAQEQTRYAQPEPLGSSYPDIRLAFSALFKSGGKHPFRCRSDPEQAMVVAIPCYQRQPDRQPALARQR